jgi:hypothetical protein
VNNLALCIFINVRDSLSVAAAESLPILVAGDRLSRNSMSHSFQFSNFGRADGKSVYLLLAPPERPRHCPSLIPEADLLSSRGQRPRKPRPPLGPTLKGSSPGGVAPVLRPAAQGDATPSGSGGTSVAPSWGCWSRLLSCALPDPKHRDRCRARKTYPPVLPRASLSDVTDSRFRLSMLRMTAPPSFSAVSIPP